MRGSVECLVRGSGKIFALLRVRPYVAPAQLRITATTVSGAPSAAVLIPYADESSDPLSTCRYVAIVPQLTCDLTLTLTATDANGAPLARDQLTLNPNDAKWQSRVNYRMKPALARAIRDWDAKTDDGANVLHLSESFPHETQETVRGTLTVPASCTESLTIEVLNPDGTNVPLPTAACEANDGSDWGDSRRGVESESAARVCTILGDAVVWGDGRSELGRREVTFTLRVPALIPGMVVAAKTADGRTLSPFTVVDDELIRRVRDLGYIRMVNASWDPRYDEWLRAHRLSEREAALQAAASFDYSPLISIVVPLYKTPVASFYEMTASVANQTYANWELVLVNASPNDAVLAEAVADVAALNHRVRVVPLTENRGIAANTNAGIAAAQGEYLGFLDHDDLLEPDALFEYVRKLNADPMLDLIYSDEDLLLPDGRSTRGYFKADFDIDLLRAKNYVCHFLVMRKTLVEACGGLNADYDGAQDHELILHASELTDRIAHVRRILYHWRVTETSTAGSEAEKDYATAAGVAAVKAHLARLNLDATVAPYGPPFTYDVRYAVPAPQPLVSILIPNKDQVGYLRRCVESITRLTTYENYELVVIENNSEDPATFAAYDELAAAVPRLRIVTFDGPFNFSKIVNYGAREAQGDYLLLLNNDTELRTPDWLERMVGLCTRSDVGAVGVKLLFPDETVQHEGVALLPIGPSHINLFLPDTTPEDDRVLYMSLNTLPQQRSAVTGACMMVARTAWQEVGGFDEEFAVAYNDIDFCLRLIARGRRIVWTPQVVLTHYESVTRGYENTPEKRLRHAHERARFDGRWLDYFYAGDPYYNASLFQDNQYYQLSW